MSFTDNPPPYPPKKTKKQLQEMLAELDRLEHKGPVTDNLRKRWQKELEAIEAEENSLN